MLDETRPSLDQMWQAHRQLEETYTLKKKDLLGAFDKEVQESELQKQLGKKIWEEEKEGQTLFEYGRRAIAF